MPLPSPSLDRVLRRAALVLAWERLWRLAWPLAAWLTLFAAVALIDLLPHLPPLWHALMLALFAAGAVVFALRLRRLRWPDGESCRRRLETDSALPHRPLSQLTDRPVAADPVGLALWRLDRRRLLALLTSVRLRPPAPGLPARDPLGLRFAPLLLLAIGLAAGRHDIGDRLERALDPGWRDDTAPLALQIWITPPAYTGLTPAMLQRDQVGQTVRIATGSRLLAELQGSPLPARLQIGERDLPFTRLDQLGQSLETELTAGDRLTIRLGRHRLASWPVTLLPDLPPEIAFAAPPAAQPDGKLRLRIAARDDYGVTAVALRLRRLDAGGGEDEVALPGGGDKELNLDLPLDLTAHRWSGLRVAASPLAEDAVGHRTEGEAVQLALPERQFRHPVARAVAALRHELAQDARLWPQTVDRLGQILSQPASFHDDLNAYLLLSTARSRLGRDRSDGAVPSVLDMLWAAALRIEEGDLHDARDAVDQASAALSQALQQGAGDEEISRLTAALNDAMQRLIASLARQAPTGVPAGQGNGRAMTPQQLQDMLRQFSDLAHAGARQAAQQSLRALQSLLDQLTAGNQSAAAAAQWQRDMEGLQTLSDGEKQLLDRTFRRAQRHNESCAGGERQTQQGLRQNLQKLMQELPDRDATPALDRAMTAMQDAEQALRDGQTDAALEAEGRALGQLQEGARQMAETMAQGGGNQVDPLGRAMPKGAETDDGKVKIPSRAELGKSREILDELRRRAGDPDRPANERAYLRRLLEKLY